MRVFVYKSRRKPDTYLYLAEHDAFDAVPEPMQVTLRPWQFVLEFDLTPDRRLPRIDARVLQNNLGALNPSPLRRLRDRVPPSAPRSALRR